MATNINNLSEMGTAEAQPTSQRRGVWAFLTGLGAAIGRLFTFRRAKPMEIPVVHEDVTLSPEGAAVWAEAMDPASPTGKPTHHRRRRLSSGDSN